MKSLRKSGRKLFGNDQGNLLEKNLSSSTKTSALATLSRVLLVTVISCQPCLLWLSTLI